nr:DEAD/DEAH box helicase [Novosphingobium panipatense]
MRETEKALAKLAAALQMAQAQQAQVRDRLDTSRTNLRSLEQKLADWRTRLGGRLVDDAFFAQGHEVSNLSAPWVPDSIHRKREALFIAAIAVHKVFIDCAAQKLLQNLNVLMDIFSKGAPKDPAKLALLPELWSTLFLVVPVLSTTFASVERMIGELPPEAIGWLLIDEAGQALPQAAVGAIMRARRSIIVGDPLQIPPVVTLPQRLSVEICNYFNVYVDKWAAPEASAQTLADAASAYQASFPSPQGDRRVGIPLLVHRRCDQPMFGISNAIAYDDKMVLATAAGESPIGRVLGVSSWLSVDGDAETKWCPKEGELAKSLLRRLADAGITQPDIFLISPFRIVAQEMRRILKQDKGLMNALEVDAHSWANDRVGTIHTVQGREAEAVVLVLGAPRADQGGARNWASGTPNVFNVAVSRAKRRLYVIGSHGAWSGVAHARALAGDLPVTRDGISISDSSDAATSFAPPCG